MKKRIFSLVVVCAMMLTGFRSYTFAQETTGRSGLESTADTESAAGTADTAGAQEAQGTEYAAGGESAADTQQTQGTEYTAGLENAADTQETQSTDQTECSESTQDSGDGMAKSGKILRFLDDDFEEADIFFADYMKNGKEDYLLSMLPKSVTVVFENGAKAQTDAFWTAERPFGSEGAGLYAYKLDISRYDTSESFDKKSLPTAVLRAVFEKAVIPFGLVTSKGTTGGAYDEKQADFKYAGGAQASDYGGYTTQYFSIQFGGKAYTGMCGKASYMAPVQGSYYVHEIPGGTKESDIVKAILLTNPLTGPHPDKTWETIADGKFNDKMLWSVHSALSVYWSDDEFGSDWIRVNAIAEMGNYLYDEWIPAHRDIMNSTHAYYLCASRTPHNSDNFGGKCPSGRQDVLFLSDEVTPQNGRVTLKKVSENPDLSSGNGCYSLAGAVYGVYTEKECQNSVGMLTTSGDGTSNTLELSEGIYYVKEIKAPEGFILNTQVYSVHVKAKETAVVAASDMPGSDVLGLELTKVDAGGRATAVLSGAQFTVKYYDGYYTKDNLPQRSDRTWVLETKAVTEGGKVRYKAYLDDKYKISGGSFYMQSGKAVLPLGTITIEETKAPEGYVLEGGYLQPEGTEKKITGKYVAQVKNNGGTIRLEGGNVFTAANYSTDMRINKIDAKTGKGLAGARLRVTDKDGRTVDEWTSDGNARPIKSLIVGNSYTMTEISVPEGYATAKPVKFTVKNTQETQNVEMKDEPTIKHINKVDAKTGEGLAGAKLRITDETGRVIDEWVSDGSPHAIEKLIVGKTYTLTEIGLPDGYVTAEPVKFTVKDTGEIQKVVMKNEQSIVQIDKVDENGKGLAGAVLRIIDKDNKRVDEWTSDGKGHVVKKLVVGQQYTLVEAEAPDGYVTAEPVKFTVKDTREVQKIVMKNTISQLQIDKVDEEGKPLAGAVLRLMDKNDKRVDEWISDGKGHVIRKLVVGEEYTLTEVSAPDGYVTAEPVKFTVKDTKEVQKIQMVNKCTRVEIIKIDAETGDMLSGASLTVHPADKEDEIIDTWVTDTSPHEILRLTAGEVYTLREKEAPDGYKIAEPVTFTVMNTEDVQEVRMEDEREDIPFETPKETKPDVPGPKPDAPKTGDTAAVPLWGGIVTLSGAAVLVILAVKLKKKR